MNEKAKIPTGFQIAIVVYIFACSLLAGVLTGCASTRAGTDESVLGHQRKISQLEGSLASYTRAVDEFRAEVTNIRGEVSRIGERQGSITAGIDECIRLLDEYQRAIERLLRATEEAGKQAQSQEYYNYNTTGDSHHQISWARDWICTSSKGYKNTSLARHFAINNIILQGIGHEQSINSNIIFYFKHGLKNKFKIRI